MSHASSLSWARLGVTTKNTLRAPCRLASVSEGGEAIPTNVPLGRSTRQERVCVQRLPGRQTGQRHRRRVHVIDAVQLIRHDVVAELLRPSRREAGGRELGGLAWCRAAAPIG
ncbi:MAG: hypothetical protein JO115_11845 [Pseudonocardiales bacterium]|nr:hypothetical protein [Pseudonocardiales bacterium]